MFQNLTGWHAIIVLAIVLLLFGAAKLPALAKSIGQSMRILKTEITDDGLGGRATAAADDAAEPATPPAAAVPLRVPDRDAAA